jgi:tetraacyldisaccharide 4'-kinase
MRAPEFWGRSPPSPLARLLSPFGALYGAAAARRMSRPGAQASLPTIVVGGFTAGGDGKTPVAVALGEMLAQMGERPAFLTRGYGRKGAEREPFLVDPARHCAGEAGDEPMLLARRAPTIVGVDRPAGARLAQEIGASVLLLDDGLQSRRLEPDLALAVVDAAFGAGNGLCMPAGPLRAPLARQLESADALVTVGSGDAVETLLRSASAVGMRVWNARTRPDPRTAARLAGKRALAFAGLARPEKFLATLRAAGALVSSWRWFRDHHHYARGEIESLEREAARAGAILVTTEKDAVRLPKAFAASCVALPIELVWEDPAGLRAALEETLTRARLNRGA